MSYVLNLAMEIDRVGIGVFHQKMQRQTIATFTVDCQEERGSEYHLLWNQRANDSYGEILSKIEALIPVPAMLEMKGMQEHHNILTKQRRRRMMLVNSVNLSTPKLRQRLETPCP